MRILLVKDDADMAARLSERLRAAGFAVDVAHSREDGAAWPEIDRLGAIVLDLGLPDGSAMGPSAQPARAPHRGADPHPRRAGQLAGPRSCPSA